MEHNHPSTKPLITRILVLLGMILLGWVLASAVSLLLAAAGFDLNSRPSHLLLQAVSQLVAFLVPSLLYLRFFHRGDSDFVGCACRSRQWLQALLGAVSLLLLTPAVDWLSIWNDSWHWGGSWAAVEQMLRATTAQLEVLTREMLTMPHWSDLLVCLLVVALIPAVCEELLFRGILQRSLQRKWGNIHLAIWFTALIFSLFHGDLFALFPRMLLGAVLGYLYCWSGSLVVNSAAHFVNNAVVVVCYYLYQHGVIALSPDEPLALPYTLTLCCTAAAVITLTAVKRNKQEERN